MLAPRFLTLFLLLVPINGFANKDHCGGAPLAAEARLHLDSPAARDVFSELPVIPFHQYVEWRDRLWTEAKRADAMGQTDVVIAHLKAIISLKRLVLISDIRNPSLAGALKASKRSLIAESRRFQTLTPSHHQSFWDEWQQLAIVPSSQIEPLVRFAIHTPMAVECDKCLQRFFSKLKISPHHKLQLLAEELPRPRIS